MEIVHTNIPSVPADSPSTKGGDVPDVVEEKAPTASPERDRSSTIEGETKETSPPLAELPQLQGGFSSRRRPQIPRCYSELDQIRMASGSLAARCTNSFCWCSHSSLRMPGYCREPKRIHMPNGYHAAPSDSRGTRELDFRVIVSEAQLQVQERAELAAQRYQSNRSYEK